MLLKWTGVLLTTFVISGCATLDKSGLTAPELIVPGACAAFDTINPSRADTLETKRQVLAHNQTYRAVCPAKGD